MTTGTDEPAREELIYHLAFATDWDEACGAGEYRVSTRGRTLEEVGFIHCSRASQVEAVASAFYADADGLVLLAIDPDKLRSEVRYEKAEGSEETFPHIYGALNTDAVVRVTQFEPDPKRGPHPGPPPALGRGES